jgi:hypothetical protein
MKLSFTVDVVLEVPDNVALEKLAEAVGCDVSEIDLEADADILSVGMFGDLILDPANAAPGASVSSYTTGDYVDIIKD